MSATVPERNPRRVMTEDTTYLDEDGCLVVRRVIVLQDIDTGDLTTDRIEVRVVVPRC